MRVEIRCGLLRRRCPGPMDDDGKPVERNGYFLFHGQCSDCSVPKSIFGRCSDDKLKFTAVPFRPEMVEIWGSKDKRPFGLINKGHIMINPDLLTQEFDLAKLQVICGNEIDMETLRRR